MTPAKGADGTIDQTVDFREFVEDFTDEPFCLANGHVKNFFMHAMLVKILLVGCS